MSLLVFLFPGLVNASLEQKQEGVRGVGMDAGGSGGSPAQGCWPVIFFLILPLGLFSTLTSAPCLPPPSLCSACLSVPNLRLQQRRLPGWLSR